MKKSAKTIRWFVVMVISTMIMMTATVFSASASEVVKASDSDSVITVMADADPTGLTGFIQNISGTVTTIGYAVAGLAIIVLAIMLIGGGNGAMSKAKGAAVGICVGIALLGCAPGILKMLAGN